jgi:hypothetical protein
VHDSNNAAVIDCVRGCHRSTESRASTSSTSRYPSSSSPASLSPRQSSNAPSSSSSSPSDYDRSSSRPYPVKEPSVRTSTSFEQRDAPNIFDRFSRRDNNSDPSSNRDVPPSRYDSSRAARPATSFSRSAPSYDRQEARRDNYDSSRPSASNPYVPIASAPVNFRAIGSSGRTNDRSSFSDSANAAYDNRPRYPESSSSSPSPSRPTPSSYANRESTQSTFRGSAAPIRSLDTRSSESSSSRMRAPAPSRHTSRYDETPPPPSRLPLADAPTPTLETIDPSLLSDLRLSMMNSSGRIPTRTEMESGLTKWLEKERVKERATLAKAASRLRLEEWRGIQLDQAWVWKREKEIELGIVATEDDLQRDERVARRMRMRKEDEHQSSLQSLPSGSPASRVQSYAVDPDRKFKEARRAAGLPEEGAVKKYARPAVDIPSSSSSLARKEREEEPRPANPPAWLAHRYSQRESFPEGWEPPKRVSREALSLIRLLQQSDPTKFTVPVLADRFKISPEAIRRILKSRFELDSVESDRREGVRKQLRKTNLARVREEEGEGPFRTSWAGDTEGEKSEMDRISGNNTRDREGARFTR